MLAVTHGGVIRAMICHLLGLEPRNYVLFEVDYAAVVVLHLFDGKGVLAFPSVEPAAEDRAMAEIILVVGGCRSGKSDYAQTLAESLSPRRVYVATCPVIDDEMRRRIERHQAARAGRGWETIEEQLDLAGVLRRCGEDGVLLVECVTLWINNLLYVAEQDGREFGEVEVGQLCHEMLDAGAAAARRGRICEQRGWHGRSAGKCPGPPLSRLGRSGQSGDCRPRRPRDACFVWNSTAIEGDATMSLLETTLRRITPQDDGCRAKAKERLDQLIMPHWALGRLMDLAVDLAGMTRSLRPAVARKTILTMAGDHGVAAEGVSKYPQEVTAQMVHGFVSGMAGINALGRLAGGRVMVVDMGVAADLSPLVEAGKIISKKVAHGTANIAKGPAMTRSRPFKRSKPASRLSSRWPTRSMCSAPATWASPTPRPRRPSWPCSAASRVADVTGRGTGIDDQQLAHKIAVVETGLGGESARPRRRPRRVGQGGRFRDRRHCRRDSGGRGAAKAGRGRWLHFDGRGHDRPFALPDCHAIRHCRPSQRGAGPPGHAEASWARSRCWT